MRPVWTEFDILCGESWSVEGTVVWKILLDMMTSSNGNIFRVTGYLNGNSPVPGEFPA